LFAPKRSEKITVYRSTQNLRQWVKYSLINSRKWLHVISDVTNTTPPTGEDRLLV